MIRHPRSCFASRAALDAIATDSAALPMIRFHDVTMRYPAGHEALRSVNLYVPPGQMVFVTGHSGAGKSTMLRLITLIERCTRGLGGGRRTQPLARLRATPRSAVPSSPWRGVPGSPAALVQRTVFDNVALPLVAAGYRHGDGAPAGTRGPGSRRSARKGTPATGGAFRRRAATGRDRACGGAPSIAACLLTNRPGISTPSSAGTRWHCSSDSTRSGVRWSSRRTIWSSLGRCHAPNHHPVRGSRR